MMNTVTLDSALDTVMQLPLEERNALLSILRGRQKEALHEEWHREAEEALAQYHRGELKAQTVEEIMADLERDIASDDAL